MAIDRMRKLWVALRWRLVTKTANPTAAWITNAPRIGTSCLFISKTLDASPASWHSPRDRAHSKAPGGLWLCARAAEQYRDRNQDRRSDNLAWEGLVDLGSSGQWRHFGGDHTRTEDSLRQLL